MHSLDTEIYNIEKLNSEALKNKKRVYKWYLFGTAVFSVLVLVIIIITLVVIDHSKASVSTTATATAIDYTTTTSTAPNNSIIISSTTTKAKSTTSSYRGMTIQASSDNSDTAAKTRLVTPEQQLPAHPPRYGHAVSPYSQLTRLKILEPASTTAGRVFVMGDIHGCLREMNALLDAVAFVPDTDVMILAGDLVFRGPDSIGVIRRAREIGAFCVRGNHDDKVIRLATYALHHGSLGHADELMDEGPVGDPLKFGNKHADIAKMLSKEDYEYLVGCPLILDIPSLNARVVHGGLDPSITNLLDNDPWSVMNMRDLEGHNREPSKLKLVHKTPNAVHWAASYQTSLVSNVTVYYGHDASRGAVVHEKYVGVDSGCIYGRQLSVVDVRTKSLFQVNCSQLHKFKDDE